MSRRLLVLNGIAIFTVLINHAILWGFIAMFDWTNRYLPVAVVPDFSQKWSLVYDVLAGMRQLMVFAVSAFLFTSGFFSAYSARGSQGGTRWKTIRVRIANLLYPYITWTVVLLALDAAQKKIYTPLEYLAKVGLGLVYGGYYYIPLLVCLTLIAPFIIPWAKSHPVRLLAIAGMISLAVHGMHYLEVSGVIIPGWVQYFIREWSPLRWGFEFCLGMVAGFHSTAFSNLIHRYRVPLLAFTIVMLIGSVIEPLVYYARTGIDLLGRPSTFTTLLFPIGLILTFLAYDQVTIPWPKFWTWLGGMSFGIYLAHGIIQEFTARMIYHFAPALLAYQIPFVILLVAIGLALPISIMTLFKRLPARVNWTYKYIFG